MAAIITDQFRILNAKRLVDAVSSTDNSYYTFVGLTNPEDYSSSWDSGPIAPRDNFEEKNDYWNNMIGMKKIGPEDIKQVIRKIEWVSGTTYDMYRHNISRTNKSLPSESPSLYNANYYIINKNFRVYICLYNGSDPENPNGKPSLDEPDFIDLEPRVAGDSGDGYLWKYLYTISPSDVVKFDSVNFIPVPNNWGSTVTEQEIIDNAKNGGQLKVVKILDRGVGVGTGNQTYKNIPIRGDGEGAEVTITIDNDSKVESVTVSNGGSGYTFGTVDLSLGNFPTATESPQFEVIIPPDRGHGFDIYRELGAYNVLLYSRIENDDDNPDFIVGNKVSRIGIIRNPTVFGSKTDILTFDRASTTSAMKLVGAGYSTVSIAPNSYITQTVGLGSTAVGRVISYNKTTGVLKYWQDKNLAGFNTDGTVNLSPEYGFKLHRFTSSPDIATGGSITITGEDSLSLEIDTNFSGVSTIINNKAYYFGQTFTGGLSDSEVEKYSGDIIYVDNRPSINRSNNQREDIKIILQF